MSNQDPKTIKIFLNSMHTWFSNFLIEELRTDYKPKSKIQYTFMGTTDSSGHLPYLFEPKIITIKTGYDYNQDIFDNDIIIFNLNDSSLDEVEFVIRGLNSIKYDKQKILILISNIMTWANTPLKEFTNDELSKIELKEKDEEISQYLYDKIYGKEEKEDKFNLDKNEENNNSNIDFDENKENEFGEINNRIENNNMKQDEPIKEEENEEENEANEEESKTDNKININDKESVQSNNLKNRKKIFYFNEDDYPRRIPYSYYSNFKSLETLALQIKNPNLKKYIICPGFIYGCGEDFFFDYFRKAWLGGMEYFPIRGKGYNFIPTIHIKDLIEVIKKVINIKPKIDYIFACDKTKEPFLKDILESITNNIGGIKLKSVAEYDIDEFEIINYTQLKINIPMKLSSFLSDENSKINFNWHCEYGIKENISKLISEFKLYRQMNSLKIIICGPPSGGKSSLAEILSKKYKLTKFDIPKIIEWGEQTEDYELAQEIRQKKEEMEELIKKALEEHEHKKNKKKLEPPLDVSELKKFPDDFIAKLFKERLKKDECIMKGYILDNFPKSYIDCQNLFCVELPPKIKEEENKDIKENSKVNKDKKDKEKIEEIDYNREVIKDSLPDCVIMINKYDVESLKNKMQKHPDYIEKQQELDTRFNRRLETYKKYNESNDVNYRNLEEFFKENGVKIFYINETEYMENKTLVEENLIQNLEKEGYIENYSKLFDEEDEVEFIKPIIEEKEENIINIDEDESKELDEGNKAEENKGEENREEEKKAEENKDNVKNKNIDVIKEDESEESMVRIQKNEKKKMEKRERRYSITKLTKKKHHKKENSDNSDEPIKKRKSGYKLDHRAAKKKKEVEEQLDETIDREQNLLEKKSEVIRRYISENIMPILAKGVLFVSRNLPDDPVEALANFLNDNTLEFNKGNEKHIEELEKMIQDTDH